MLKKAARYIGFDKYDSRKLRFLKSYSSNRAEVLVHSANNTFPFTDNRFDSVTCFEAIEHIEKDNFAVSEIYRVLKPNCSFICSTPLRKGDSKGHYHIREYRFSEFKNLIESSFSKVRYFGQGYGTYIVENSLESIYILCVATK